MRSLIFVLFSSFLTVLLACSADDSDVSKENNERSESENSSEQLELKLGHVVQGEDQPYNLAAKHFSDLVEDRTSGEIKITIFPGGQLGTDGEMLESIQNGTLDMGFITATAFSGSTNVLDSLSIPFLFDSYETYSESLKSDVANEILDSLSELNVKGLGINNAGLRHFGSNIKPINTPEDLKGLKIRVMESELMLDIYNTLGASPTPMAYGELYSALQTGVMDAHETNIVSFIDENFHEVTEYISVANIYPTPNINIMNLDIFNELSNEHQEIIEEAAFETSLWISDQLEEIDDLAYKELEELGKDVNIIENTDQFIEILQPVYEKYSEIEPLIKEFIEVVETIKEK